MPTTNPTNLTDALADQADMTRRLATDLASLATATDLADLAYLARQARAATRVIRHLAFTRRTTWRIDMTRQVATLSCLADDLARWGADDQGVGTLADLVADALTSLADLADDLADLA